MKKIALHNIRIFLLLSVGLWPAILHAQVTKLHNLVRAGDKIVKQQVNYVSPGEAGQDMIWDFSSLTPVNEKYELEYLEPELLGDSIYVLGRDTFLKEQYNRQDLIVGLEHYTLYYYRSTDSTLCITGFENPVTQVHCQHPVLSMRYPFEYGCEYADTFEMKGIYSGKIPFTTRGSVAVRADATGLMILPDGDTLNHVTRVKTVQTFIQPDTIPASSMNMRMESYRWYAAGYRYPVFETLHHWNLNETGQEEVFKTAFFYPPQEHTYLEEDVVNMATLDKQDGLPGTDISGEPYSRWDMQGEGWACDFYPNPVERMLNVVYQTETSMPVRISLHDMSGKLLKNISLPETSSGYYTEEIDCSTLPAGNYVCKFVFGTETESRIIQKK